MKKAILILSFLFFVFYSFSQNNKELDSLINLLPECSYSETGEIYGLISGKISYLSKDEGIEVINRIKTLTDSSNTITNYYNLTLFAKLFADKGDLVSCLKYIDEAIGYAQKNNLDTLYIQSIYVKGYYYQDYSQNDSAIFYFIKAIKLFEDNKDFKDAILSYHGLGDNYYHTGNYKKAKEYYTLIIEQYRDSIQEWQYLVLTNNIALCEIELENYEKAIAIFQENYDFLTNKVNKTKDDSMRLAYVAAYLGMSYFFNAQNENAQQYGFISLDLNKKLNDLSGIFNSYINIAKASKELKLYNKAENYLDSALLIANKNTNNYELYTTLYPALASYYEETLEFEKAYYYLKLTKQLEDSLILADQLNTISEIQAKYDLERYQTSNEKMTIESQKNEKEIRQQNIIIGIVSVLLLLVLILVISFYKNLQKTRIFNLKLIEQKKFIEFQKEKLQKHHDEIQNKNIMLEQKNEEIQAQAENIEKANNEIKTINELLAKKNFDLTDSIFYASKIQFALLPNPELIKNFFPENFIMYRPRDIVSGDFYFFKQINNSFLIAAADCTGHGVPGAFMSMLGITLINEIVRNTEINSSSLLFEELRLQIKNSLKQTGIKGEQQDGMDMAFCWIDAETLDTKFTGSYNPLWIIRKNEIITYEADRQPIGVFMKETPFTEHKLKLEKGDVFYLFSDGYYSQFGKENNEKFVKSNFRKLLFENHTLSMDKQKEIIEKRFDEWKGDEEQTDDVLVIGIRI